MSRKVPTVRPKSRQQIEDITDDASRRILPKEWHRIQPFPVLSFFERLDDFNQTLSPGVDDLSAGVMGEMRPEGDILLSVKTYEGVLSSIPRDRFTAAHECGHAVLHFSQVRQKLSDNSLHLHRRGSIPAYRDPEWQANAFAAALLMPRHVILGIAKNKPDNLENEIARLLCVSSASAAIRLRTLNLV